MKIARNRFAGALAMLALAACGGEQAPATPAAADNTPAAEAPTAPETPPATVAPPVAVVAAAPARLGPPGCGKPGTQLEDSRGPYAVADVAIGMTLQEAWDAIACRAKLKKNGPPGSAISTTANGPAGPVDVPTRRAEVITEGNGGPMTQEVFSIFLAGPKDAERVVMIEGRMDYSADALSREQVIEKLSKQYGALTLIPQLSNEVVNYAAVEAREGASATCDIAAQVVSGCRRITSVQFITALKSGIIVQTTDYDFWASFAPR